MTSMDSSHNPLNLCSECGEPNLRLAPCTEQGGYCGDCCDCNDNHSGYPELDDE
jgi:hypothetical protein